MNDKIKDSIGYAVVGIVALVVVYYLWGGWAFVLTTGTGMVIGAALALVFLADRRDDDYRELEQAYYDALAESYDRAVDQLNEVLEALGKADDELDAYDGLRELAEQLAYTTTPRIRARLQAWLDEHPASQTYLAKRRPYNQGGPIAGPRLVILDELPAGSERIIRPEEIL